MTPDDGWAWEIAKTCYHSCDGMWHEGISHLAQTHLTVEPFMIATNRNLGSAHPLYKLLKPHCEGTALINYGASELLIARDGDVDQMFSADLVALYPLITSEVSQPSCGTNPDPTRRLITVTASRFGTLREWPLRVRVRVRARNVCEARPRDAPVKAAKRRV
ncbi:unnamed protein product [Discosporangium mesarthrocarpum]